MSRTNDSRSALARARFFLEKARQCPSTGRPDFEAYLEAAIVFARAAIHRFKTRYERHPEWGTWWDSLRDNESVEFFRHERDWILKTASSKIGQKVFVPLIGSTELYTPDSASDFYYFETPEISAVDTVAKHLRNLEVLLHEATTQFTKIDPLETTGT